MAIPSDRLCRRVLGTKIAAESDAPYVDLSRDK